MENEQKPSQIIATGIAAGIAAGMEQFIQKSANRLLIALLMYIALKIAYSAVTGEFQKDDTDGAKRSGMMLHTDNKTGCQYLSVLNGGITPRRDNQGNQLGCYEQ